MSDTKQQETTMIATMDQVPSTKGPRAESPLYHAELAKLAQASSRNAGVSMQELAFVGHLVIRGDASNSKLQNAMKEVLEIELPGKLESQSKGDVCICWIAPDEWLVMLPGQDCFAVENKLRDALEGHFAIVNVSGGQTILNLSGVHAQDVLKKSTGYDVHERNFPVGKVVTTTLAKSQAIIMRTEENEWQLIIRRSFSDYLWNWLMIAADEYGVSITV